MVSFLLTSFLFLTFGVLLAIDTTGMNFRVVEPSPLAPTPSYPLCREASKEWPEQEFRLNSGELATLHVYTVKQLPNQVFTPCIGYALVCRQPRQIVQERSCIL